MFLMYGLLLAVSILKTVISAQPALTPQAVDVMENSSVILTCTDPTKTVVSTAWTRSDISSWAHIVFDNGICTIFGFLNEGLYLGNCSGNGVFTVTIPKTDETQHNITWRCRTGISVISNDVTVYVKVPVKSVDITTPSSDDLMFKEDKTYLFTCKTTYSRPTPSIEWFLQSAGNTYRINATSSDILTQNEQQFISVKNVLSISFRREQNGGNLFCNGNNGLGLTISSRKISLNVTFPPDGPPVITGAQNGRKYQLIEHEVAHLSCAVSGGNPLAHIVWFCLNGDISAIRESNTVTSNITWTALRSQQNTSCFCVAEHMFGNRNTSVTVAILYPPGVPIFKIQSVTVFGIKIIQNNSLSVTCSSRSNPEPDYAWIMNSKTKIYNQILHVASIQKHESGEYMCTVNNTMVGSNGVKHFGTSNSSIEVQVLSPPNQPRFRYIDKTTNTNVTSQSFDVIKGDIFTIYCLSEANPNADYRWEDGSQENTSLITAIENVNKTCTATNTMKETVGQRKSASALATVTVRVLYPPEIPTIRLYNSSGNNVSKELKIIEREPLHLVCESDGRPSPNYNWYVNDTVLLDHHIFIRKNVSRNDSGKYTCNAFNTMTRTFGKSRDGSNNRSIEIDVLYPAEVDNQESRTVIEGDLINISCPVIQGNPAPTSVKWSSKRSLVDYNTAILHISHVSRYDEDTYICSVKTIMRPTYSPHIETVNHGYFHLSVVYRAQVKEFYVWNQTEMNILTVNETENVTFMCDIDSKPSPTADISVNGNTLFMSQNNTLLFTKESMQCTDFGTYTCSGMNDYNNDVPSTKSFILYVNCSPRPSPFVELKLNVTSQTSTSATLSFTAVAYPYPRASGYVWNFIKGSKRVPLANNTNIGISTTLLQSNLTIHNVNESDYGQYVLQISNTIGVFEQWFNLIPNGKMSLPTKVEHVNTIGLVAGITVTSVAIFVVVLIVLSVYLFRKRSKRKQSQKVNYDNRRNIARVINESSSTYETLDDSQRERDLYSQLPATYEQLENASMERSAYSELENTKHDMSDYVNIRI